MIPFRTSLPALLLVVGFCLSGAGAAFAQSDDLTSVGISDLHDAPRLFSEAVAAGDAAKIGSYYDQTAILLLPDGSVAQGRENITRLYGRNFSLGDNRMEFLQASVQEQGDRGAIVWLWRLTITPRGQAAQSVTGRSLVYFGKSPFGWKIIYDMYQVMPPPAQGN